jgi:hypothetical protein
VVEIVERQSIMLLIDRSRVVEVGWTGGAEGSDSEGTSERADSDGRSGFKVRWYPRKLPGMCFIPRLDGGLGPVTTWPGLGHRENRGHTFRAQGSSSGGVGGGFSYKQGQAVQQPINQTREGRRGWMSSLVVRARAS